VNWTTNDMRLVMAASLFALGLLSSLAGLWTILAREYQQAMRSLSHQSTRIASEAITEKRVPDTIQATANLVQAVTQLVRTATGVGVLLFVAGLGTCYLAYTMMP
jgi:hypothetical protein